MEWRVFITVVSYPPLHGEYPTEFNCTPKVHLNSVGFNCTPLGSLWTIIYKYTTDLSFMSFQVNSLRSVNVTSPPVPHSVFYSPLYITQWESASAAASVSLLYLTHIYNIQYSRTVTKCAGRNIRKYIMHQKVSQHSQTRSSPLTCKVVCHTYQKAGDFSVQITWISFKFL